MTCWRTNPEVVTCTSSLSECVLLYTNNRHVCALEVYTCVRLKYKWTIWAHKEGDATPPVYPSPRNGQMRDQEMKSFHLVVGNGIRKRWPFVGSFRPQSESHDSQIFTVALVTGLVKSQHTSLLPKRPKARPRPCRLMHRWAFFSSSVHPSSLHSCIKRQN